MNTSRPAGRGRLAPLLLAASLVASLAVATPGAAAEPQPAAPGAPVATEPFRIDLYREGDFVPQTNLVQCVGASMQMMLNMMRPVDDRSAAYQLKLQNLARRWSPRSFAGLEPGRQDRPRRGASSRGWAFGLTLLGFGPYRVTSAATMEEALRWGAVAMRRTGRPVGLLVWQGAHAWVMSGFEATGDPLVDRSAEITHVMVQDPLYPRTSSAWGRSPAPDSRLSLGRLDDSFVPWRPGRSTGMSGRFVVVLPLVDERPFDRRLSNLD
jgi:hypothetical protein